MTLLCLSVDMEEDLPGVLPNGTEGIEQGIPGLLRLFDDLSLPADFFFLASVVRDYPELVRQVATRGYGIGNHGLDHELLCAKSLEAQRRDIKLSTEALSDLVGVRPHIFRAPNFSANYRTFCILDNAGYAIDSSVMPGRVSRSFFRTIYNHKDAPSVPHHPQYKTQDSTRLRLLEVPVAGNPLRPGAPLGLGALNVWGPARLSEVVKRLTLPVIVFLIHPWELVDLSLLYSQLPPGYARACSGNLQPLREFLLDCKKSFRFGTLEESISRKGGDQT